MQRSFHMQLTKADPLKSKDNEHLFDIIKQNPLATLVLMEAENSPHISHIPCHLDDSGDCIIGHVSNRHPLARKLQAKSVSKAGVNINLNLVFNGESHYVSPNDIAPSERTAQLVPTWHYSNVHVQGEVVEIINIDEKYRQMVLTSAYFEQKQAVQWTMDKLSTTATKHMLKAITVFKVVITELKEVAT